MTYDNTNKAVLFRNERKARETHADYEGTVNIDGQDYYLNMWLKETSSTDPATGKPKKFMSGTVKPKGERRVESVSPAEAIGDDDIPF